nr:SLC13 family permease [Rhabdochromatium marinum]
MFGATVATTLLLWFLSLLPDFVPALMAMLAFLVFGLAPESVVLSGFSSNAFLLTLSVLGLGAVVVESGLARRYSLMLLHHLPAHTLSHQIAVFMTGAIFTPMVPTIAGRATIVAPVVEQIANGWDEATRTRASTMLYTTGLDSVHYLAPIFLTAAPANLMIFALLPPQDQQAYDFIFWAYAASVTGLVLVLSYGLCAAWFFRRSFAKVPDTRERIGAELAALGPTTSTEWIALVGISLLGLGILTIGWHRIDIQYLALGVLCLLLLLGSLSRNTFIARIDWAFLALLGSLIGIIATMNHLGIDDFIVAHLAWLGLDMQQHFGRFVLLLAAVFLLARLVIPLNQAIIVFAAALLPIASQAGISPWAVGFVLLVLAETAFFAHQSPYIFLYDRLTSGVSRDVVRMRLFHLLLIPFKLAALLIAIPFWKHIGVL